MCWNSTIALLSLQSSYVCARNLGMSCNMETPTRVTSHPAVICVCARVCICLLSCNVQVPDTFPGSFSHLHLSVPLCIYRFNDTLLLQVHVLILIAFCGPTHLSVPICICWSRDAFGLHLCVHKHLLMHQPVVGSFPHRSFVGPWFLQVPNNCRLLAAIEDSFSPLAFACT